jgi:cell division septum initiation protein DivIVA
MIDEELPNISITKIQVNTKFKPQIIDGEDLKTEIIKRFHDAVHTYIEQCLVENEDLEQEIIDIMQEDYFPSATKGFSDLGEISIQIIEEQSVEVKQKDLGEVPKTQTKLEGF